MHHSNSDQALGYRHGRERVTIKKLLLLQTGTFHEIYNRPYQMELDDGGMDTIRERLSRIGNAPITSRAFKNLPSGILAPVSDVDFRRDLVRIPDGWDRPRVRFMMEVMVESSLGGEDHYYIQGFSESLGINHTGRGAATVEPNMRMFVNGFIRVQYVERNTPRGRESIGVVKQAAQVINGRIVFDIDTPVSKTRTVDLFSSMQERMLASNYSEKLEDSRTRLNSPSDSVFAKRSDVLPMNFLSSSLETYRRNTDMQSFGVDSEDILARTQQELDSDLLQLEDNAFLRILSNVRGEARSTEFTINDLLDIDPDIIRNGVIDAPEMDARAKGQLAHHDHDVSDWRGGGRECRWAQQISTFTVAIMMQYYHRFIDIHVTNRNHENRVVINVANAEAIAGSMPVDMHERMLDDLVEAFESICDNGRVEFDVLVKCSLYNQADITLAIDDSREERYYVPTFADGLLSPFYARDTGALGRLSEDLERLIGEVSSDLTGSGVTLARSL